MFVHTWSNLPLGPDVNCSRKHCHSRDLSQRQCQRSSMIFPTDNKTEIRSFSSWLTPQFDEFFDFLRSLLCLLCASISPHCHSTVFISWLWDSMSMCKSVNFWSKENKPKDSLQWKTESKQMLFITSLFTLITVTWSRFNLFSHNNLTEKKLRKKENGKNRISRWNEKFQ